MNPEALILQMSEALEACNATTQLTLDLGALVQAQAHEIAALKQYLYLLQQSVLVLETRVGK